ncbi:MAG: endonuclease III [Anaerolineales bacterium]|nr:endonuclease III [Anaerolineales bacterium]
MNGKQLATKIHQLLVNEYGHPTWRPHLSPVGELVSTILSQNTNDINRDLAYDTLRQEYPTWEEVRDAPEYKLIEYIRIAGLANQKGPAIQNALKVITKERGKIELEFLKSKTSLEASSWLTKLKGVGPKTAAIVLLFSLDMPAFPVDTHVHRITGRIGIRPDKMTAAKAHTFLAGEFSPDTYYPVHLNLIRLGREICKARKPLCQNCPLNIICNYYNDGNTQ